jgi:histone H3/H4
MSVPRRSRKSIPADNYSNSPNASTHSATGTGVSKPRITPRNSILDEAVTAAAKETPYGALRQLANMMPKPSTPLRRGSSTGPPSTRRSTRRTPAAAQERTPGGVVQHPSTRKPNFPTPHTRAALREVELRRAAALTPGKDRRRSGRQQQRETPRDALRALSRVLAPTTKPSEPSPVLGEHASGRLRVAGQEDDVDDGEARPVLSMALDDDDDDSMLLPTLQSVGLNDEENFTQRSVELPRNIVSRSGGRMSRGSFGSIQTNDRFADEFNEVGLDPSAADRLDSSFIQQFEDDDDAPYIDEDTTRNFQSPYLDDGTGQISLAVERMSDVRPEAVAEDETENTFVLQVPPRDSLIRTPIVEGSHDLGDKDHDSESARDESEDDEEGEDSDVGQVEATEALSIHDPTLGGSTKPDRSHGKSSKLKKRIKISKHGEQYSSLPVGVVKRMARTFMRTSGNSNVTLSRDTLDAIMQASDWFLEQVSDDLGTYAQHAGRKTIDENDVITLMKRYVS